MSHFTVLVIGEDVEGQLAPYQENNMGDCPEKYLTFHDETEEVLESWENQTETKDGKEVPVKEVYETFSEFVENWYGYEQYLGQWGYWENPNAKWDWYLLGGRWSGFFKLKENKFGTVGKPGIMTQPAGEGRCDRARKGDIDFDGMFADAEKEARERFAEVEKALEGLPLPKSWTEVRESFADSDIDLARETYNSQPAIKTLFGTGRFLWSCPVEVFHIGEENALQKYIDDCKCDVIQTFAVVKDGKWYEKGSMGMFACVFDEKSQYDWSALFNSIMEETDDDTLFSVVDCHI